MIIAANEQAEALASGSGGKALWTTPLFHRLKVDEAAGGDSVAGDGGSFS